MFEEENEDEEPLTLEEALIDLSQILRWLYFDYMVKVEGANFKGCKELYMEVVESFLSRIHDKYEDHVEGTKKTLKESQ